MTTSPAPFLSGMSLRSTRVLRAPSPPPPSLLPNESAPTADSHLTPNLPPLPQHEQPPGKIQRDSTSPLLPENEKQLEKEQERRLTRSRANSIGMSGNALGSTETPSVAIERMVHRKEECPPGKKDKIATQKETPATTQEVVVPKREQAILPALSIPTQKKMPSKPTPSPETNIPIPVTIPNPVSAPPTPTPIPASFLSPYGDYRKSYRKTTKTQILSFPYRKHHDPLEGRIISLLNKMTADKDCRKELDNLAQRVTRAGGRECRNRYVVAGLKMVLRMVRERQKTGGMAVPDSRVVSRLGQEMKTLQGKILSELEDYSQYLPRQKKSPPKSKDHHAAQYRSLVMKKLYSVLKQTKRMSKEALRERVVRECEGFFRGELSMDEMLRFVRRRLEEEEL